MIHWRGIVFILRVVLIKLALLLLIPLLYAWVNHRASWLGFAIPLLIVGGTAGLFQYWARSLPLRLRVQELFISTTAAWLLAVALSAVAIINSSAASVVMALSITVGGWHWVYGHDRSATAGT